ncbi:MAG: nitrous oxide reductase family maturation protein NosD [Promethearchaeota archaeon]
MSIDSYFLEKSEIKRFKQKSEYFSPLENKWQENKQKNNEKETSQFNQPIRTVESSSRTISHPQYLSVHRFLSSRFHSSRYIAHTPIFIEGNADFLAQAALEGWDGTGTLTDPFVITGYEISVKNKISFNLIMIKNTDLYFQIRSNFLKGYSYSNYTSSCVLFENVTNGMIVNNAIQSSNVGIQFISTKYSTVKNNTLIDNNIGISLSSSSQNTLINNNLTLNSEIGIFMLSSKYNSLINNTIQFTYGSIFLSDAAIRLDGSFNNNIFCNTLNSNSGCGILLYYSFNNQISSNEVTNNFQYFIALLYSTQNMVSGNSIHNSLGRDFVAIWLAYSSQNTFSSNTIYDILTSGILIELSDDNLIVDNVLYNVRTAIGLVNSTNNEISANIIYNSGPDGILLFNFASNNTIVDNTLYNITRMGILLVNSTNNYISTNNVNDSSSGIYLLSSVNNTIFNNTLLNNDNGIELSESTKISISNNTVYYNRHYGIVLEGCANIFVFANALYYNHLNGIFLDELSSGNKVHRNDFINNNLDGISQAYDVGSDNFFSHNYWNNWISPDTDGDGIVDAPYQIEGFVSNTDQYPLITKNNPSVEIIDPSLSLTFPIPFLDIFALYFLSLVVVSFAALFLVRFIWNYRKTMIRLYSEEELLEYAERAKDLVSRYKEK